MASAALNWAQRKGPEEEIEGAAVSENDAFIQAMKSRFVLVGEQSTLALVC